MNTYKNPRLMLFVALVTGAMDFFHLGLVYPLFTEMVADRGGSLSLPFDPQWHTFAYAVLIAAFPLGQFLGSTYLGRLSDKYGRRRLLLVTVAGSGVGMVLCGYGVIISSFAVILAGRLLGGLMGANLSLAYATIVDMSTSDTKVKNLSLIPLCTSIGFTLGPLMTAVMGSYAVNLVLPFAVAAMLSAVNWLMIVAWFEDSGVTREESPAKNAVLLRDRSLWTPLMIVFLMIGSNFLLIQFIGPLASFRFDLGLSAVSWVYVNLSVTVALGHIFVTRRIANYASPRIVLPWALTALAVSLVAIVASKSVLSLHCTLSMAMLCCAVAYTNAMAYLSDHVSADRQGEVMGLGVAVQCLAEWLPPVCLGVFAAQQPSLPLVTGAIACLLGGAILRISKPRLIHS